MSDAAKKLLIVSVGGSPQPVIHSLNSQQPDYIVYFCSRGSRSVVRQQIEPALTFSAKDHDLIVTPDEQELLASVKVIMEKLPLLLADWSLDFSAVIGDYTGGTKTMSAALVLALSGKGAVYSYVGGLERDKQGLGVVINGREQMLRVANPWDVLAIDTLREIRLLFNRCRFRMVQDLAEQTAARVVENRSFFEALQYISAGLYGWDNFQYRTAFDRLRRGLSLLRPFVDGHPNAALKGFSQLVAATLPRLESIQKDAALFKSSPSPKDRENSKNVDGQTIIADLLANAVRRAEIEYKYDDAVARLYSAIEKMAKVRLKVVHGLDNSNLDLDKLPPALSCELVAEGANKSDGKVQLPLHRSFMLLADLNDSLGLAYCESENELSMVLNKRNSSLLAHGFEPVTEDVYRKLLLISLEFAGLAEADLPQFPLLDWSGDLM